MANRRNKHNTCKVNNLTLACLVRETHGGLDDRVSVLQRMISLCEYDEYNINEKNVQVLFLERTQKQNLSSKPLRIILCHAPVAHV